MSFERCTEKLFFPSCIQNIPPEREPQLWGEKDDAILAQGWSWRVCKCEHPTAPGVWQFGSGRADAPSKTCGGLVLGFMSSLTCLTPSALPPTQPKHMVGLSSLPQFPPSTVPYTASSPPRCRAMWQCTNHSPSPPCKRRLCFSALSFPLKSPGSAPTCPVWAGPLARPVQSPSARAPRGPETLPSLTQAQAH